MSGEESDTYISRGDQLIEQRDYDGAVAVYTEAASIEPKDGFIYQLRGDAYRLKGDMDRAIVDYSRALSLYDDDEDMALTHLYRAAAYKSKSEYHNVIADANEAIKRGFFLDAAYLARGIAHYMVGPVKQAFEDLKTAADLGSKGALKELEKYGVSYTPNTEKQTQKPD